MNKKGGMQLSINMIIVIIIAFVFLGVAIYFIQDMFPEKPDIPTSCDIYPPNADDPICVKSEIDLKRGKSKTIGFSFYNDEDDEVGATAVPTVTCNPSLDLIVTVNPQAVPINEHKDFLMNVEVDEDVERQNYQCTLQMSEATKPITIEVT